MPAPGKIQLKDKFGRVLVETETPESLIALAPTIGLLNVPVLLKTLKKQYTGYVQKSVLDEMNVRTVQVPATFAGLEAVDVPTRLMDQLFEIYDVDEQDEYVEISARHIFYRNLKNNTLWKPTEDTDYTAAAVMRNVMSNAMFESEFDVATDCTDTQPGKEFDFERKNLVECFLDPENGICAKFGLSMIRDNSRFYCLKNVGYDRGYLVESGKNLIGVDRHENLDGVATRVAPYGKTAKGDIVWLDHNGKKYIDSQYIDTYAAPMLELYDTGLQIGKDGVTEQNIQAKLLEAGQKRFSEDEIDKPEVTMTINFIALGDTEEFAQYRGLDKVYLYDILTIRDAKRGYNYSAQVIGVEHDILTGRLISVTIGSIKQASASRKIAVWQVPEVDGRNIRLLSIQAGMFEPGSIFGEDLAEHIINYAHFASATIDHLNADAITAITAEIENIIAGHITAESIKASAIEAINATLGTATIEDGYINNAVISYLKVKAATAESLIARDAVTDRYFIDKLQVRNLQSVEATVGNLVVKAADNKYYRLEIGSDGSLTPVQVTPTAAAIAEGKMGTGTIIETDLTVADLSASNMKGINALIDKLTASRIDVDELFARSAFIGKLNTTDISSNTYLQLMVNSKNKTYRQWAEPSDPHDGDTWYKQGPQPISEMQGYTHAQLAQYPYWAFDGYQLYRRENGAWRKIDDPAEIRSTVSRLLMENNRIDIAVMQLDSEMDNKYTVRSGIAIELDGIEISGSKYLRLKTGGKLVVDSGNFDIDENGNVTMAGKIIAYEGLIGGFDIGATRQSAGSGANYICLDSGTAGFDYFIMAGGESAANAKFLLTKDGKLTVESLTVRNEAGTGTEQINLSNYALWKLAYQTVRSYTASSITLSNGAVINFNTAAGVVLSGGWTDNWTRYTVTATDGQGQVIDSVSSGAVGIWLNGASATRANVKSALESSSAHTAMISVEADGEDIAVLTIDAAGVYSQGYSAGERSVYITDIGQMSAPTYSNGYYTVHARADASNGRYLLDDLTVNASAAYNAGWNAALAACGIPGGGDVRTGGTYYANLYVMNQSGPSRVGAGYVGVNSTHVDAK